MTAVGEDGGGWLSSTEAMGVPLTHVPLTMTQSHAPIDGRIQGNLALPSANPNLIHHATGPYNTLPTRGCHIHGGIRLDRFF